ncbi:MAG: hypothetical protein M5U26_24700 [Planctomycetota bacterium]|nr:hypothetical protein [Planctomycetota bacterium]
MAKKSRASELVGYSFLTIFANDDTIDEHELGMLERLALEDLQVDEKERQVLRNIFSRVERERVTERVWTEMQAFRAKYGV